MTFPLTWNSRSFSPMSRAFSISSFSLMGDPSGGDLSRSLGGRTNPFSATGVRGRTGCSTGSGGALAALRSASCGTRSGFSRGAGSAPGAAWGRAAGRAGGAASASAALATASRRFCSFSCFFRTARCILRRRLSSLNRAQARVILEESRENGERRSPATALNESCVETIVDSPISVTSTMAAPVLARKLSRNP